MGHTAKAQPARNSSLAPNQTKIKSPPESGDPHSEARRSRREGLDRVGRCVVASRYLVARAWVGPDAEGAALAMGAVVDIGTTDRMVGRVAELGVLGMSIGRAAAGSVQVVAISGEAGIGKSRLAQEGLRTAGERGFRTLESAAGRLHRDLSYAPIVEALRPLVAEAALVDGLSDLARLFDGLRVPPLVALGDPGLERTRMFEAVRTLIERASARLPLAIFIDDLHWADPGTLALLHYLVRGLPQRRCLFLLTYRADEAGDELRELLTALQRAETLTPVELAGLDAAGVEDLAAAVLDGPAPPALREMLDRRSGGVPLYVKAIVLRLIETGALFRSGGRWVLGPRAAAGVPVVVSTLLRDKIKALPPPARRVLDVLAVCGGAAEHVLLLDVADGVVEGVTELRAANVIVEDTRGGGLSYRVVHPVLAEVAYDLVPVIVRRQLHARLAEAVERHRPDDVRLLAAHIRAAGDQVDPPTHWKCLLRQPASTWPDWPAMRRVRALVQDWTSPGDWAAMRRLTNWPAPMPRLVSLPDGSKMLSPLG